MLDANSEQHAVSKNRVKQNVLHPLGQTTITVGCRGLHGKIERR